MFERYDEQSRDRKFSVLCAFIFLILCIVFIYYESWGACSVLAILALIFGVPPFFFGKERFEKTVRVLSWIGTFGWLG